MNALKRRRCFDDGTAAEICRGKFYIIVAENDVGRDGHRQYLGEQAAAETQTRCRNRKRRESAIAKRVPLVEQRYLKLCRRLVTFLGRHPVETPVDLVAIVNLGDPCEFAGQER